MKTTITTAQLEVLNAAGRCAPTPRTVAASARAAGA